MPVIAARAAREDMVDTLVEGSAVEDTAGGLVDKHAIPAEDMDTCPVIALRDKSAITVSHLFIYHNVLFIIINQVERLVTSAGNVLRKLAPSVCVTNASSLAMSRLHVPIDRLSGQVYHQLSFG